MYFLEGTNTKEGKLIRHKYTDVSGKEYIETIALCCSEKEATPIVDFLNIYEKLNKQDDFTRIFKKFMDVFLELYNKNRNNIETIFPIDSINEIFSLLKNSSENIGNNFFLDQITDFLDNLEMILNK